MIGQKRKKDWLTWIGDLSPIFLKELQKPRQPLWAKKQSNSLTMNLTILLEEEERELLSSDFPKDPSDDLQDFFETHREHLARDKKLSGKWERYIYRNPQTYHDFLVGLLDTRSEERRVGKERRGRWRRED